MEKLKILSQFYFIILFFNFILLQCQPKENNEWEIASLLFLANSNSQNKKNSLACPPIPLPEVPIATKVEEAKGANPNRPFGDPIKAINGICGAGQFSGSLDVYELEDQLPNGQIILSWEGKTVSNEPGVDFIVLENGFQIAGKENEFFVEPILVEVSYDGTNYCGFQPKFQNQEPDQIPNHLLATQIREDWQNLAGLTPVLYNMRTNPIELSNMFSEFNPQSSGVTRYMKNTGGDGFDLDHLSSNGYRTPGSGDCNPSIVTNIQTSGFRYLKLTAAQAVGFPKPLGVFRGASDIDGVIARRLSSD